MNEHKLIDIVCPQNFQICVAQHTTFPTASRLQELLHKALDLDSLN